MVPWEPKPLVQGCYYEGVQTEVTCAQTGCKGCCMVEHANWIDRQVGCLHRAKKVIQ